MNLYLTQIKGALAAFTICLFSTLAYSQALPQTAPNPNVGNNCPLKITLVLDESGSIGSQGYIQVRQAVVDFMNVLNGTGAQLALIDFASSAQRLSVNGSVNHQTINTTFINSATLVLNSQYGSGGTTNWADAFTKSLQANLPSPAAGILIFFTDGNPVPNRNNAQLISAINISNQIKAQGTHIFMLGVGSNLTPANLQAVSGMDQAPPNPIINADYSVEADLTGVRNCLLALANSLNTSFYEDNDGDGFGDATGTPIVQCNAPVGYVANNLDCNDANASISPNAIDICDGIDNNCDGIVDNGIDSTPPTLSCPANITADNDAGRCGAIICYPVPLATDNCRPATPTGYTYLANFGNSYYYLRSATTTYDVAELEASVAGGHLANITSKQENDVIANAGGGFAFIGGNDLDEEGTFVWSNCEDFTYSNFANGEPNGGTGENYIEFMSGGQWNDIEGTNPRFAIIEIEGASITQTAGLPANAKFPVGTTTNTFVATDASGNTSTCSFDVIVNDVQAPVLLTEDAALNLVNGLVNVTLQDVVKESEWVGFITAFNLPQFNSGVYQVGVEQLSDMKTTIDANAGTITLQPNFSKYASGDPNYQNGAIGNKFIQASTYVEETALVDQFFTFSGFVQSNTLASGYDNYAFLRLFDQNFGLLYEVRDPLIAGESFEVIYDFTPANTFYVQYGFSVEGLNANPADEAALGSVVVEAVATLGDNCGAPSIAISPSSFDCEDIGAQVINVTSTDASGNSTTSLATVDVVGAVPTVNITSTPASNSGGGGTFGGMDTTIVWDYGAQSLQLGATVSGGSNFTYSWVGNTADLDDPNSATPLFTPTSAGIYNYNLIVTNEFGCEATSSQQFLVIDARCGNKKNKKVLLCHNGNTICISKNAVPSHLANHTDDYLGPCTNKASITGSTALNVYPSPSRGLVNLELEILEDADLMIEVFSATGQLVYQEAFSETAGHYVHGIDLSAVSSGVYMIKVMNDGVAETQRIQIQR